MQKTWNIADFGGKNSKKMVKNDFGVEGRNDEQKRSYVKNYIQKLN